MELMRPALAFFTVGIQRDRAGRRSSVPVVVISHLRAKPHSRASLVFQFSAEGRCFAVHELHLSFMETRRINAVGLSSPTCRSITAARGIGKVPGPVVQRVRMPDWIQRAVWWHLPARLCRDRIGELKGGQIKWWLCNCSSSGISDPTGVAVSLPSMLGDDVSALASR
jgi:hypothetical protein